MTGRYMRWLLWRLPPGLILLAASAFLLLHALPLLPPEELPDYDYLPQARQLAASGEYEECIQLCEDIIEQDLPHAEEALHLLCDCETRRASPLRQSRQIVRGFVTGNSSTFESATGAVISDLTLYGDVRDLSVQSFRYLTGRPTDPFVAALSAVGLATELADGVDWLPAVLKAFKRAGVLSGKFSNVLMRSARALFSSGPTHKAARGLFGDLATLFRKGNLRRSKAILRGVDTAGELKVLVRAAEKSPGQLHLACRSVGSKKLAAALRELPDARTLQLAARKGPRGVSLLRELRRLPGRRYLKWGARVGKVFCSRHASELMRRAFERFPQFRMLTFAASGILALIGILLALPPLRRRRREDIAVTAPSSDA